jgi:hypothetical protein
MAQAAVDAVPSCNRSYFWIMIMAINLSYTYRHRAQREREGEREREREQANRLFGREEHANTAMREQRLV